MFDADRASTKAPPLPKAEEMLSRINAVRISADQLAMGVIAFSDLPEEKRADFDHRMLALLRVFQGETQRAQLMLVAMAIDFRLRALTRLLASTFVHGCDFDIITQQPRISPAALQVASDEPLMRDRSGLATFDVMRFKARLLH